MIRSLAVVDRFLDKPAYTRAMALEHNFEGSEVYQGHEYPGVVPFENELTKAEIQQKLSVIHGHQVKLGLCFFRMSLAGAKTPAWIHPDTSVDSYASVLYLSLPRYCTGGTAFWKHKALGWERLPSIAEAEEEGTVFDSKLADRLNRDANDATKWDLTGLVQMKFNRLVTYPTDYFHSRFPKENFGDNYDNGRLILVAFYS